MGLNKEKLLERDLNKRDLLKSLFQIPLKLIFLCLTPNQFLKLPVTFFCQNLFTTISLTWHACVNNCHWEQLMCYYFDSRTVLCYIFPLFGVFPVCERNFWFTFRVKQLYPLYLQVPLAVISLLYVGVCKCVSCKTWIYIYRQMSHYWMYWPPWSAWVVQVNCLPDYSALVHRAS